jgi:hypothetical protein
MEKIKVYLSARISKDAHEWNNFVCENLGSPISVFMPQKLNPGMAHEKFPKKVFDVCLFAMKESHIGLLLPEYGRDCAFEVGWYANSHKPLIIFVDNQINWLRDWMIKGGVDYVITTNPKTWEILINDPILKSKPVHLIEDITKLKDELIQIYEKHYKSEAKQ